MRRLDILMIAVLLAWILGWGVNGLLGATGFGRDVVSPELVSKIVEANPGHKFYLVFDEGSCGTPYRMTLNYLYNRVIDEDLLVITGRQAAGKLRGLRGRGPNVVIGSAELLSRTVEQVDALLIERLDSGELYAYPFRQPNMREYISILDDVFGTSEQQFAGSNHRSGLGSNP